MSLITPYFLEVGKKNNSFEFVSEGTKGKILKLVLFTLIQENETIRIYNLAFGDRDEKTGEIDDLAVSDNGDTEKVLSTVVATILLFLHLHNDSNVWVYATGSTPSRNRLYQMGIARYLNQGTFDWIILGETEDENWEPFRKGIAYSAFMVRRKRIFDI